VNGGRGEWEEGRREGRAREGGGNGGGREGGGCSVLDTIKLLTAIVYSIRFTR